MTTPKLPPPPRIAQNKSSFRAGPSSSTSPSAVTSCAPIVPWLIASLLYGSGARVLECLQLRVKDRELTRGEIVIRDGKGSKDRVTVLPAALIPAMENQLERVQQLFNVDRQAGRPGVTLPHGLARKYPQAPVTWGWQYVFPAKSLCRDSYARSGAFRHRMYPQTIQRAVAWATHSAGIAKHGWMQAHLPPLLCNAPA